MKLNVRKLCLLLGVYSQKIQIQLIIKRKHFEKYKTKLSARREAQRAAMDVITSIINNVFSTMNNTTSQPMILENNGSSSSKLGKSVVTNIKPLTSGSTSASNPQLPKDESMVLENNDSLSSKLFKRVVTNTKPPSKSRTSIAMTLLPKDEPIELEKNGLLSSISKSVVTSSNSSKCNPVPPLEGS